MVSRAGDALPSGRVTFLFTDIEGSTRRWEADPDGMRLALARHDEIVGRAVTGHGGTVFKHTGDGMCAVFTSPGDALLASVAAQVALEGESWPDGLRIRARMGVHTGEAEPVGGDYFGTPLNRCARVMSAGHGGQIVCTETTKAVAMELGDVELRNLGEHRLRDLVEAQHLYQVAHAELPSEFPPLRTLDARRHNLPVPRTSFVGRERNLAELGDALRASRLVTVTGVGGSGKTRLSLQAAADAIDDYADGVFLAELASSVDPAEITSRVAAAMGLPLAAAQVSQGSATDVLLRHLADKHVLLIVDNCEHLLDGCAALVDEILARTERVGLLATSREPLGVAGERILRVPSLRLAEDETSVEGVIGSEAGLLFADRAALARPGFTISAGNLDAVAQVCRRLDGIPLAIELAAARLRHLSAREIADRLDDRFRILTGGGRTALPRQQTLRATLEWSHDLLSEDERTLFRRCAVFIGSFTLAGVEAICIDEGVTGDALDVLSRLVDRSLVVLDGEDTEVSQYRLLETMRHFAQEKLLESGESEWCRDRHRDWYAAQVDVGPISEAMYGAVVRTANVVANMRSALEWAVATGADDQAHRLVLGLATSFLERGLVDEAAEWFQRVAARPWSESVTDERAWVLTALAIFANLRNEFATGLQYATDALAFVEEHGPVAVLPHVYEAMAISSSASGGIAEGEVWMERAASTAADLGHWTVSAMTWMQLAGLRIAHDPAGARAAAEEAITADARSHDEHRARILGTLAFARVVDGDLAGATQAIEDMDRTMASHPLDPWGDMEGLLPRAGALAAIGRASDAVAELHEGLLQVSRLAIPLTETAYLVAFGAVAAFGGDLERALMLLGAARQRFDAEHAWRVPVVSGLYVHANALARANVAEDVARAARASGFGLSIEEAFRLAADPTA